MSNDDAWTNHQLKLGLSEERRPALPEATAQDLVEALRDLLLLTGIAMVKAQEVDDDD